MDIDQVNASPAVCIRSLLEQVELTPQDVDKLVHILEQEDKEND